MSAHRQQSLWVPALFLAPALILFLIYVIWLVLFMLAPVAGLAIALF